MNINSLTFGAEFEVLLPEGHSHETAVRELAARGLTIEIGRRTDRGPRRNFKIVYDQSVGSSTSRRQGAEFVSPILRGEEGLAQVAQVAQTLAAYGCGINSTCGFHVHVGGFQNRSLDFFKTLVRLYSKFQDTLDLVHPVSRRTNNYCRSLAVNFDRLNAASTLDAVKRAATPNGRYSKLNLDAYDKHSTVEFRQHAGTVDHVKAVTWIKTCLRLVAAAQQGKTGTESGAIDFSRLPEKARIVALFITRENGATRSEIVAAHPMQALSVNRQARIAGLEVRTTRERGQDRFYATAGERAAVPSTLEGLAAVIESAAEERAYLAQRAAEYA